MDGWFYFCNAKEFYRLHPEDNRLEVLASLERTPPASSKQYFQSGRVVILLAMISTYRYGTSRKGNELRIGVARQAPRGVRRQDYAKKNYFDLWLRALGPSPQLFRQYRAGKLTFRQFASRYRSEMSRLEARQILAVVAALAQCRPVSLGCYCEDEDRCHRSVLKKLLAAAMADLPPREERRRNASPVCYAEEDF